LPVVGALRKGQAAQGGVTEVTLEMFVNTHDAKSGNEKPIFLQRKISQQKNLVVAETEA